jgi:ABC-2 type transport system ATP-binding protein
VNYDEAAIDVDDLTVCYATKVAVASLDLRVAAGEVVALLGRNGAGKTSTVETLEGYRRPSRGRVRVLGLDPTKRRDQRALASRIGVMLQKGGVYPGMGAREALRLFAAYYEHPADPDDLIEALDLGGVARTPWRRMSGGE